MGYHVKIRAKQSNNFNFQELRNFKNEINFVIIVILVESFLNNINAYSKQLK